VFGHRSHDTGVARPFVAVTLIRTVLSPVIS
jgi:hypothetical protein